MTLETVTTKVIIKCSIENDSTHFRHKLCWIVIKTTLTKAFCQQYILDIALLGCGQNLNEIKCMIS